MTQPPGTGPARTKVSQTREPAWGGTSTPTYDPVGRARLEALVAWLLWLAADGTPPPAALLDALASLAASALLDLFGHELMVASS